MFVGEIASWLVIFSSYVYRVFIHPRISREPAPLFAGGYQVVSGDDREDEDNGTNNNNDNDNSDRPSRKPSIDIGQAKLTGWKVSLLAAPACCDITGTTLMNVGLLFVAASVYQMTRGALVLFVGLFSVLFLRRKLYLYQWLALFGVFLGVALVGVAGALYGGNHSDSGAENDATGTVAIMESSTDVAVKTVIGILLIAVAQIFTATQFVLEEWILEHYSMDALEVVGWEGTFGLLVTIIGMIILYVTVGKTEAGRYGYFDTKEGWRQITSNRSLAVSSILSMISIG